MPPVLQPVLSGQIKERLRAWVPRHCPHLLLLTSAPQCPDSMCKFDSAVPQINDAFDLLHAGDALRTVLTFEDKMVQPETAK